MKKKITEAEYKKMENAVWQEYLEQASEIEIFQSVCTSNYDDNSFLLNWVMNRPETDRATILAAYWMLAPRWMKQYKDREDCLKRGSVSIEEFDLVEALEQKYLTGFYEHSYLAYNPKNDMDGFDWTSEYLDKEIIRDIPDTMFQALEGEPISRPADFDSGLPIPYAQRIMDFFKDYEIVY